MKYDVILNYTDAILNLFQDDVSVVQDLALFKRMLKRAIALAKAGQHDVARARDVPFGLEHHLKLQATLMILVFCVQISIIG